MSRYNKNDSLRLITTLFLFFIIIALISAVTIKISLKTADYGKKTKDLENVRIALSYVNMVIKHNGDSKLRELTEEGKKGFIIDGVGGSKELKQAVYFEEGKLYDVIYEGDFDAELAELIVEVERLDMDFEEKGLTVSAYMEGEKISRFIAFRGDVDE